MVNVALISHASSLAGAERMLANLAIGFEHDSTLDPFVLVPDNGTGELQALLRTKGVKHEITPPVHWFPYRGETPGKPYFEGVFQRAEYYADALRRAGADIVISNTLTFLEGLIASRFAGIPCIAWVHGILDSSLLHKFDPLQKVCEAISLDLADQVVTCSDWARAYYLPRVAGDRLRTIHNWTEVFPYQKRERISRKFVSLSTLEPHKGVDVLIQAVALLRDKGCRVSLDIYGDGYSRGALRSLTTQLRLGDRVRFHGRVTNVEAVYDRCAAVVMPSYIDAFGMVAIEALARGAPVISSRAGGLREVFAEMPQLTFDAGDAAGLAERMAFVVDHPDETETIAAAGHAAVASRFTSTRAIKEFSETIARTLDAARLRPMQSSVALDAIRVALMVPWSDELAAKDHESEGVAAELSETRNLLGAANHERDWYLRQIEELNLALDEIRAERAGLMQDIAGLQRELAVASGQRDAFLQDIAGLQRELAVASGQRDEFLKDVAGLQRELASADHHAKGT